MFEKFLEKLSRKCSFGLCLSKITGILPEDLSTFMVFAEYNQQDATFHNLFISVRTCSIIKSSKLHIQRQVFVRSILLPAASLASQLVLLTAC